MTWKESSRVRRLLEDPKTRTEILNAMRKIDDDENIDIIVDGKYVGRLVKVHMCTTDNK